MIRSDACSSGDNPHLVLYTQPKVDGEVTGPKGAPPAVVLLNGPLSQIPFCVHDCRSMLLPAAVRGASWPGLGVTAQTQNWSKYGEQSAVEFPARNRTSTPYPQGLGTIVGKEESGQTGWGQCGSLTFQCDVAVALLNCVGCDSPNKLYTRSSLS